MDMLQNLLGGGQKKQEYDDFVQRYEQGHPSEGYSDGEVMNRYSETAERLPPEAYERSAEEAFDRLSPEERVQFGRWLRQRARSQNVRLDDDDMDDDDRYRDPHQLAGMTSRLRQQEPGMFQQLLGGGGSGGAFDNPLAKAAVAGIVAMAASRIIGRR